MVVNSLGSNGNDSQVASTNPFKVTQNVAIQSTPKYSDEIPPSTLLCPLQMNMVNLQLWLSMAVKF